MINSTSIPSLIHHALKRVKPVGPTPPKGQPLSQRIRRGSPYLLKIFTNCRCVCSTLWSLSKRIHKTKLLNMSRTVRGSQRSPFPARNHPLKSTVHVSLQLMAGRNAVLATIGPLFLGLRRVATNPQSFSHRPIAATDGNPALPNCSSNIQCSLRAPQVGLLRRARRIRLNQTADGLPETLLAIRCWSFKPRTPFSRKR